MSRSRGSAAAWRSRTRAGLAPPAAAPPLARQPKTPIKHFISLMQENHSFDNYFGTYPGADGIPDDVCMPIDPADPRSCDECVKPFHLGERGRHRTCATTRTRFSGQYNGRARWTASSTAHPRRQPADPPTVMGYYDDRDIPSTGTSPTTTSCSTASSPRPRRQRSANHMYWVTGTPGNYTGESIPPRRASRSFPTIFDRLEEGRSRGSSTSRTTTRASTSAADVRGDRGSQIIWVPLARLRPLPRRPRAVQQHRGPRRVLQGSASAARFPRSPTSSPVRRPASTRPAASRPASASFAEADQRAACAARPGRAPRSCGPTTTGAAGTTTSSRRRWTLRLRLPGAGAAGQPLRQAGPRRHARRSTSPPILKFIEDNWGLEPLAQRDRKARTASRARSTSRSPPRGRVPHRPSATCTPRSGATAS